ncbi:MAG: hypothetical protein ABI112_05335 [Terracoccus sp.]
MTRQPLRSTWLRVVGVTAITATIALAAACSDQDTVNTVPPPWPTRTVKLDGPASVPASTAGTAGRSGTAATGTARSTPPTSISTTKTPKPTLTSTARP